MRYAIAAIATLAIATTATATALVQQPSPQLLEAVKSPSRTPANVERDKYRHPAETLAFFGVKPTDTVVEIWPAGGWYTEILAPYVKAKGSYYAAALWPEQEKGANALKAKFPEIKLAAFPARAGEPAVPAGTADVVLTFRNVHNWRMGYQRGNADYGPEAFKQMFAMLKPGGILGVVDHRLPESADIAREMKSGYIKTSTVKQLAADAGFELVGESAVNANPKDTADWEKGVWTLPPRYANGDTDRAKYEAIGESDRMTLKFRKPKK